MWYIFEYVLNIYARNITNAYRAEYLMTIYKFPRDGIKLDFLVI